MEKIKIIAAKDADGTVIDLWQEAFGDTREEIMRFFAAAGGSRIACFTSGGKLKGMAVLIPVTVRGIFSYYGYAVCTAKDFRGKGVCRKLHGEIFRFCKRENAGYILHPANAGLFAMYEGFGMSICGYCGEKYIDAVPGKCTYRRALPCDTARRESDTRWESTMIGYLLGDSETICAAFDSGMAYGKKEGDILSLSYVSGVSDGEIAAFCAECSCRGARLRTHEGNIPYLCGFNIPFHDIYIDFTFE